MSRGRIDTASLPGRYRAQIAAQLGGPSPISAADPGKRLRQSATHGLNKLETDAWEHLKRAMPDHEIIPHGLRLVLANGVTYLPDFIAKPHDTTTGRVHCIEVKGPLMRDDASVKLKAAAHLWPVFTFSLLWRDGRAGAWSSQEILS